MANRISTVFDFSERGNGLKKIKADVKEADGLFGKAKAGIKGFSEELKTNRAAQAAVGTAALAAAKIAIDAASDLGESVNAVRVVYKDAADDVLALGDNSADAFGLSQRAFNEFAVQFSAFASQIADNSGRSVVEVVEEMTTRVADFASVHNLSMEEAARVVQSTMAGETEAFRRFGGDVSAATIKAYAYEEGIASVGAELTEGQKVLARYGAFMEQTSATAGDFANTSDSLANQQRRMAAEIENLSAEIGTVLIPAAEGAAKNLLFVADSLREVKSAIDSLPGGEELSGGLFSAIERGINPIENLRYGFEGLSESLTGGEEKSSAWVDGMVDVVKYAALVAESNTDFTKSQDLVNESIDEATDAAERADKAHRGLGDANQYVAGLVDKHNRVVDEQADAYWEAKRAVEGQSAAIDDLIGKQATLVGGDIAVRNSQREAAEAMREFNADAEDQQAEIDGVVEKQLAAAQAAADHRVEQLEASGEMVNSRQKAQIFADELGNLAGSLSGPVLEAVLRYIDELNRIPRNVNSQITFSVSGAKVTAGGDFIGSPTGFGGRRAMGGPVSGGRLYEVGEGGKPELFEQNGRQYLIPGDSGKVTPASDGGSGGGGVRDIHLHFDARGAIGMNEQQVQRWLVESLRKHVRFNGSIKGVTG